MLRIAMLTLAATTLAACATSGSSRYLTTLDALIQECEARGGILVPIPGPPRSGNERANHACEIRGGGGRVR